VSGVLASVLDMGWSHRSRERTLQDLQVQNDHELLAGGLADQLAENRAAARRSARLVEFFRRQEAREAGQSSDEPFALTARQQTTIEVSALWALPASWVRRQLNNALWTATHFPYLWELALAGRIDSYRAGYIAETARTGLDTEAEYAALAARMTPFLERHLRADAALTCTHKQLRNKLAYEIRVLRSADAEQRFRNAHANRGVRTDHGDDGISWLTIAGTSDQVQLAAQRLTLSARSLRADGDERTIEQIRADLALDLILGVEGAAPVPAFARPIINLTVPIQTVMGLEDRPGFLSGGQIIPAGLARVIAQSPDATWHRMLTDPSGRAVEVSTERYRPTRAIWEQVVAEHPVCFRSGCDQASTTTDLDHREEWPQGETTAKNLWPACRTDHRAKHALGFSVVQTPDGGFALKTPAGFVHDVLPAEHPTSDEWTDLPTTIQFSATELVETLQQLQAERRRDPARRHDLVWEYDLHLGFMPEAA
jgi:hypothetical protein